MKRYLIVCIGIILQVQCLNHQFADKMLNEKRLAVDNSQLCQSFITRKLCIGSKKLQKLCKSLSLEEQVPIKIYQRHDIRARAYKKYRFLSVPYFYFFKQIFPHNCFLHN